MRLPDCCDPFWDPILMIVAKHGGSTKEYRNHAGPPGIDHVASFSRDPIVPTRHLHMNVSIGNAIWDFNSRSEARGRMGKSNEWGSAYERQVTLFICVSIRIRVVWKKSLKWPGTMALREDVYGLAIWNLFFSIPHTDSNLLSLLHLCVMFGDESLSVYL